VATAVGGVPDILSDESAWLVAPRDADALARAVTEALERRAEADERARVAAATLDARFSNQAWLDAYQVLYRQVLARSSR
jgi:glycosyltransferase involved in cell wall biosynthesis